MAFASGSVVGLAALYDAAATFMATAGWTNSDTITTRDKMFKSTGIDGKVNMNVRLMANTEAGNPFGGGLRPSNVHNAFPYIFALGYGNWNDSTHVGTRYFGQVGPWFLAQSSTSAFQPDNMRIYRFNASVIPVTATADTALLGRTRKTKAADCYENPFWVFDGRRKCYGGNGVATTSIGWCDIPHGESNSSSGSFTNANNLVSGSCIPALVHDAVNDKDTIYFLNNNTTLVSQWWKYDVETDTYTNLAAPTWAAGTGPSAGCCAWDGADTIYVLMGSSTTNFAKYSISGNSWTNLAATPTARSSSWSIASSSLPGPMYYIPSAQTQIGQDVIYVMLPISGTVIHRYDVTSNAWRSTSGTGALTAQQTITSSSFVMRYKNFLYYAATNSAPGTWWRADLSAATPDSTWASVGSIQTALRQHTGMVTVDHIPAKIRSHASVNTNYWFLGNADSVIMVTKVNTATPHYYAMYFGRINGSNRTDVMTTTAPVTAGGRVTITVDDTSKYHAGDPVLMLDPSNVTVELISIFDVLNGTQFRANVANNYTTGTRIGIDPSQWGCGGNGFFLCLTDPGGIMSDNEPAQYIMEPLPDAAATLRSSPGKRGLYQPVPVSVFNADTGVFKNETRGFLQNFYNLSTAGTNPLQSEQQILVDGHHYIFFKDTETSRYTVDTRGICIGPID